MRGLEVGVGGRGGDELSVGSHLAPSCYFWGRALLPLLDGGKSTGRILGKAGKHGVFLEQAENPGSGCALYCLYPTARLGTAFS